MLRAALFIVICGCVMTYNHDCQTCIGVFGVFDCQSSRFSKCAVIHGSESTIREIRLFNCDAWIIPTGWSPDSHVTIRGQQIFLNIKQDIQVKDITIKRIPLSTQSD